MPIAKGIVERPKRCRSRLFFLRGAGLPTGCSYLRSDGALAGDAFAGKEFPRARLAKGGH
jgi:hypothetical protein